MSNTSVIITCHNYGRYLSWCINSLLHQSKAPHEIIVINDSSTDDTDSIVEKFKNLISYYTVNFRDVSQSRNFGLSKAGGEYVLFLDADDFLDNYALELMENELDANPQLKLVYSDQFRFGRPDALPGGKKFIRYAQSPEFNIQKLQYQNFIALPALIRKKEFPGFDRRIKANEDWDAWLSCLKSDEDARRIDVPLFSYRKHGKNKTFSEHRYIERLKILLKHGIIQLDYKRVKRTESIDINNRNVSFSIIAHSISKNSQDIIREFVESERKRIKLLWLVCTKNDLESNKADEIKKGFLGLPVEVIIAENIDAAMFLISRRKYRYELATTEALLISDFKSSMLSIDDFETDFSQPIARISTSDLNTILSKESWKDIGPVLLNRSGVRYLYYLLDDKVPNTAIGKFIYKVNEKLARYLFWRFQRKHHQKSKGRKIVYRK